MNDLLLPRPLLQPLVLLQFWPAVSQTADFPFAFAAPQHNITAIYHHLNGREYKRKSHCIGLRPSDEFLILRAVQWSLLRAFFFCGGGGVFSPNPSAAAPVYRLDFT